MSVSSSPTMKLTMVAVLFVAASTLLAQTAPPKEPEELTRLRQEFKRRREAAVKPIIASYGQQLELLIKSLTQRGQLDAALSVRKELDSLSVEDQVEFRNALLQWKWAWLGNERPSDVFLDFRADGTVSHRGMHGTWSIIGPNKVKLIEDHGRTLIFLFNESLESYKCISGALELHGQRAAK